MIELVLTVCLLASPTSCRDERANLQAASLMSCMVQGQVYAARWITEHPAYSLQRWRCGPRDPHGLPI
jgi:hypothetical protein